MAFGKDVPQEVRDAVTRIGQAIDKELGVIGPASEWARSTFDDDDTPPEGQVILGDWILLYATDDIIGEDTWNSWASSVNLPSYRRLGLVHGHLEN